MVGAEAVGKDEVFVAGAFDADVECVEDGSAHVLGQNRVGNLLLVNRERCGSGSGLKGLIHKLDMGCVLLAFSFWECGI